MPLKQILKALIFVIISLFMGAAILVSPVMYELSTKQEFFPEIFDSAGDCRFVNLDFAIKHKYHGIAIWGKDKHGKIISHLIAVDNDNKIYDFSKNKQGKVVNINGTISLNSYIKKYKLNIMYIINYDGEVIIYNEGMIALRYSKIFIFLSRYIN